MSQWGKLYDRMTGLLTFCEGLIAGQSFPAFHRTFVSAGDVAFDIDENGQDELLAVSWVAFRQGLPGLPNLAPINPGTALVADLLVTAVREVPAFAGPDGQLPNDATLIAQAQQVNADRWTLMQGIVAGCESYSIWGQHVTGQVIGAAPYGPQGNIAGTTFRVGVDMI